MKVSFLFRTLTPAIKCLQTQGQLIRRAVRKEARLAVRELNGQACKARADKKQIFSTRSVGELITDYESLLQALSKHVGIAAAKARKQGSTCKNMIIFASSSPHDEHPVSYKAIVHFPCSTNCSVEQTQGMSGAASQLFRERTRYYKIGIGLIELVSETYNQLDLFNPQRANPVLMNTLDSINHRYGSDTVFFAAKV